MLRSEWEKSQQLRNTLSSYWSYSKHGVRDIWPIDGPGSGEISYDTTFETAIALICGGSSMEDVLTWAQMKFGHLDIFDVMGSGYFVNPNYVNSVTGLRKRNVDEFWCNRSNTGNLFRRDVANGKNLNRSIVEADLLASYYPVTTQAQVHFDHWQRYPNVMVCRPVGPFRAYSVIPNDADEREYVNFTQYMIEDMALAMQNGGVLLTQIPRVLRGKMIELVSMIEKMGYKGGVTTDGSFHIEDGSDYVLYGIKKSARSMS
ncbi:MAG: hypothetical protein U0525_03605 [Patescibacteria group bacterium]